MEHFRKIVLLGFLFPLAAFGQLQVGQRNFTPASGGGSHAMTVVQAVNCGLAGGGAGPTYTCSFSATPANASILISCIASAAGITISPTPTSLFTTGANANDQAGIISGATTGTTSVTVTLAGAYTQGACIVAVVTGVVTSSPVDVSNPTPVPIAMGTTPYATAATTGSVTTTNANDAIVGFVDNELDTTYTVGTGYTLVGTFCETSTYCIAMEFANVSSTGANNPPITQSIATTSDAATVALKLQ